MFDFVGLLKAIVFFVFGFIVGYLFKLYLIEREIEKAKKDNKFLTEKPNKKTIEKLNNKKSKEVKK